jgi:hypothetical protein
VPSCLAVEELDRACRLFESDFDEGVVQPCSQATREQRMLLQTATWNHNTRRDANLQNEDVSVNMPRQTALSRAIVSIFTWRRILVVNNWNSSGF